LKRVDKPWGWEEVLVETPFYRVKRLMINPGHRTSLHWHRFKTETLITPRLNYVPVPVGTYGSTAAEPLFKSIAVIACEVEHIPSRKEHRLEAKPQPCPTEILEVSVGDDQDVVRIEDDYGRR